MRTHMIAIAALVSAGALTINAQTPTTQQPQQQTGQRGGDQQRAGSGGDQTVTITGCLREEKDVPGRTPNVAERAGMGADYILTNVKMGQGSSTSGIGLAQMYEVDGLPDAELKKHINHQVEVVGKLPMRSGTGMSGAGRDTTGGGTGATGTTGGGTGATGTAGGGTGATGTTGGGTTGGTMTGGQRTGTTAAAGGGNDLPEIEATSIRMVAATCQAQQ